MKLATNQSPESILRHAELVRELRDMKAEMKRKGIRKTSCFNGGHSPESYRLNARIFAINAEIQRLSL